MSEFVGQPETGQPQQVQPKQPKKKHPVRNTILVLFVLGFIAVVATCSAVVKGASDAVDNAGTVNRQEPYPVAVGKAFQIPGTKHAVAAGWKLSYTQYIGTQVTATVTNTSAKTSTAAFHIKFLKGSTVVGNMQCISNDLEPKQSESVSCINTVDGAANLTRKGAFDTVTAEASL